MNLFKSFSEAMILQKSTFFVVWIQRLQQLYKLWLVVILHHSVCELRWPPATDWWPVYLDVPMSRCRPNSLTPATQMSLLSYHPSMMDHHAWPQYVQLSPLIRTQVSPGSTGCHCLGPPCEASMATVLLAAAHQGAVNWLSGGWGRCRCPVILRATDHTPPLSQCSGLEAPRPWRA